MIDIDSVALPTPYLITGDVHVVNISLLTDDQLEHEIKLAKYQLYLANFSKSIDTKKWVNRLIAAENEIELRFLIS